MTSPTTVKQPSGARARIYQAAIRLFAESGRGAVTVSELADTAGIARGTIYNNIKTPENLFGEIASSLAREMILRTEATMRAIDDPAERIATGMRLFVRRAHEERDWGRFLTRFVLENAALSGMMRGPPAKDIRKAIKAKTFSASEDAIPALVSMLTGTTVATMSAVIHGDQAWRIAGSEAAELFLRACGANPADARHLSTRDLPPLAPEIRLAPASTKRNTP